MRSKKWCNISKKCTPELSKKAIEYYANKRINQLNRKIYIYI